VALDPVPLAIGNGAVHTDETMRVLVNAATRDASGVVLPGHFKPTALGTPGPFINIAPGGMVIRNTAATVTGESYVGRAGTTTQWAIPNTPGSTLVMARIVDPDFSPWQPSGTPGAPNTSVPNGPYFMLNNITGVSSSTTLAEQQVTYAAEAIARIDNPGGATNITSAMIVDLRRLFNPRYGVTGDVQQGPGTASFLTSTSYIQWPVQALSVYVPRWATHAQCSVSLNNVRAQQAGDMLRRVRFGTLIGPEIPFDYNGAPWAAAPSDYTESLPHTAYAEFDVRALQGQTVQLYSDAKRVPSTAGNIFFDFRDQLVFEARFMERVV
jgi:hypothetical protein